MRVLPAIVAGVLFVAVLVGACSDGDNSTDEPAGSGTVTVVVNDLEEAAGLTISSWVLPLELADNKEAFGGAWLAVDEDSFSAQEVMHPQGERYFDIVEEEVAILDPGSYRFIIEAFRSSGPMYYGCEALIEVVEGEPLVLSLSSMPTYTGSGFHWTPSDQLRYPQCPEL